MQRIILFFVITFAIFAAAVYGLLSTAGQWIPIVTSTFGKQEEANKFLIVIPAAVATLLAALTAGVTALLQVSAQRAMNKELAEQKAAIDVELDKKRNALLVELEEKKAENMKVLEDHKSGLTKDLDQHRDEISRKRAELDEKLDDLKEARDIATSYRFFVGQLRTGTYSPKETKPYHPKLVVARDRLPRDSDLYTAWIEFMQWGLVLEERAERLKAPGQIEVWKEPSLDHQGHELGVVFADSGERVLSLIEAEISNLRKAR